MLISNKKKQKLLNHFHLITASWLEQPASIDYLMKENEIEMNQQDNDGKTAIHYACRYFGEEKTFEGKTKFELLFQKPSNLDLKVCLFSGLVL
jgi:hypothetical protein